MQGRKWRKKPSEELIKLMEESVDLKLYLIHERGPLSLTFQDEQGKKYEINIGNEISCSCGGGKIEHCAHTLFALNKIYKIPFNNPLILQLQYTDQELNTLMEKKKKKSENKKAKESKKTFRKKKTKEKDPNSNQMSLLDDPVCPICQEDMYSNEGIYFCKPSCGHNFHIGCLKVFIKHKKETEMIVSCPMCRAKWEEEEYIKPLMEIRQNKCTKCHKGIDCANCQRTNIKFERFHCLNCDNYDLCIECFSAEIHREKNHCFIYKKHNEDKWTGCEYLNKYDEYDDYDDENKNENNNSNKNKNNLNYVPKNISLTNFLTNCLPDYKKDGGFEIKMDEVGNGNAQEINNNNNNLQQNDEEQNDINSLRLGNNMQRPVIISPKCAICKVPSKLDYGRFNAKTLEFLMLKYLPNCQHVMHVKCCEKAFRLISYQKHNKFLVVSQHFNKCRHDNTPIFPGLLSINIIYEKDKKPSTGNGGIRNNNKSQNKIRPISPNDEIGLPGIYNSNKNNNIINKRVQGSSSMAKKRLIEKLLREAQMEKQQNMGFGLNIQKLNFGGQNDIQKYEMEVINKGSYNEKMKRKGMVGKIPYTQIHKIKKTEHIVINNINKKTNKEVKKINKEPEKEHKENALINAGASLIIQKYNARPARCEGPSKFTLSPLLINLPLNDN